jgi:hypothetical protein
MGKGSLRYVTEADMPAGMRRLLRDAGAPAAVPAAAPAEGEPPRRSKYGNSAAVVDGIRFDSKREAAYYEQLKLRQLAGDVLMFLLQVPLRLKGGTRYVVDFLVFERDGKARWIDVKGVETQVFRIKKREIEATYPIQIEIVK